MKNHHKLIAVDLSRQKELDTDTNAIQQIEFVQKLKNIHGVNPNGAMFVLVILGKIKEMRLNISQGSVAVL